MATIKTSIQLTDGMSPALRSMNSALNAVTSSGANMQRVLDNGVNPAGIQATNDALNQTAATVNQVEQEINQSTAAQHRFNAAVESISMATRSTVVQLNNINEEIKQNTTNQERFNASVERMEGGLIDAVEGLNRIEKEISDNTRATERFNDSMVDTQMALSAVVLGLNRIEKEISDNTRGQKNFNTEVKKSESLFSGLIGKVGALVGAYAGIQAVGGIIQTADAMTTTAARLSLINDGLQTTEQLQDKIYQAALRSRGEYTSMADAVAKLGQRAGAIFKNNDETIAFAETLNKMFVIAGASQAEMSSATLQLTQALGSGVLRGEEFNAVFEAAPNVMQAVADYMQVPIGSLREMAAEGKITAETVKNALFAASADVNEQFASMPYTWAQVWTTIQNVTLNASRPILQIISDITKSERFIEFVNGVGIAITRIIGFFRNVANVAMPILGAIYDGVSAVFNFVSRNWSLLAPVIWGVVAAMAAYKTATMLAALWSKRFAIWEGIVAAAIAVKNVALGIAAGALALFTGASFSATAAQWGLNGAMYACPLTWIVIAIIAIITVLYLAVAAINHFAGTSISATGIICGVFMGLYAHVYNVIANMWNQFAIFAEFLANVFSHPIYSIKALVVNFAVNFLDNCIAMTKGWDKFATAIANAFISAINVVLEGWNWLIDTLGTDIAGKLGLGKATKIEARTSITSDLTNARGALLNSLGEKPEDYWTAPRMEFKDVGATVQSGYNWGADAAASLEQFMGGLNPNDAANGANDIADALSGALGDNPALDAINRGVGDINDGIAAGNKELKGVNNAMSVSDDELNYIHRIAEREAINKMTRNEIRVSITNNNSVSNGFDVKKIGQLVARQINDEIAGSQEGLAY